MNFELALFDRMQCTRAEKNDAVTCIASLVMFSHKSRKLGLVALEDDIRQIDDGICRRGLQLVIDGCDPEIVSRVLLIMIYAGGMKGAELLTACIRAEGILAVQTGTPPGTMVQILTAYLGKDADLWDEYFEQHQLEISGYRDTLGTDVCAGEKIVVNATVGCLSFENLAGMADIHIQKILRGTDSWNLAIAMKGASPRVIEKIYANLSSRAARLLKEDIDGMGPVRIEDVVQCQQHILNVALRLSEAGEIIIADGRDIIE